MQNLISAFINGALSAYMVEVKSKNITGSLTHKNLVIQELEIFPDALLQHRLPILIKKGLIKNVEIHIPTRIFTEPIIISIDSVTIIATIYTRHPTPDEIINMKIRLFKSYNYFRKRYKPILGFLQKDSFISFFRKIMSNVIIEINHINIRIEYPSKINYDSINPDISSNIQNFHHESHEDTKQNNIINNNDDNDNDKKLEPKNQTNDEYSDDQSNDSSSENDIELSKRFELYEKITQGINQSKQKVNAIGIVIPKIVIHNPDNYEMISNEKITKEVVFSELAVYMDVEQTSLNFVDNDQFISQMDILYNAKNHNWLLKPFSFSSLIKYEKDNPALLIEPIMKTFLVNIREEYIPFLFELLKLYDICQKVISVAHIPKSSPKDPLNFWNYIHKCALTKISNPSYEFTQNIGLLIKRAIFIKNYKKKNAKSLAIINEMEEKLDYSTIIAFRAAYRLSHKKKNSKGKSKITSRTTEKIINEIKIDPIYLVTAMISMFSINMKCELISIVLRRNPGKKHIIIYFKNMNLKYDKDLKSYQIHATISNINVCYKNANEKKVVFTSIDNASSEMKIEMFIPFHSYSNWFAKLETSKNNYIINMKSLFQIIADVSHLKFPDSSMNINNIIEFLKRRKFELIIQINSSELKIVGSKNTRAIEYAFDLLYFSINSKTLEGTFNLNNSWISFITTQATKISSDFSISGYIKGKRLNISIPLFSCAIPFQYIVIIQDFVDLFLQYQGLIRIESFPKIDVIIKLNMKGIDMNLNIKHMKQKNLQIRSIKLKYKNSFFKLKLSSIKMAKLLSLRNLKVCFDKKSLYIKLHYISTKVIDLIDLIPKDAVDMFQKQKELTITNENDKVSSHCFSDSEATDVVSSTSIELPKIKIEGIVKTAKIDIQLTDGVYVKFRIKDIKAEINKNKIMANGLLEKIKIGNQIISKQILYQSKITIGQFIDIMIKIDNCDFDIDKNLLCLLLNLKYNPAKVVLPHNFGMKISFELNQMTISNDLKIKNLKADITIYNSKIKGIILMDSIHSSFVKFKTNELINFKADIIDKSYELLINLKKITVYVISLIDLISKLPLDLPKAQTPNANIIVKINPIDINLCFVEDVLNIILNSPLKLNVNTLNDIYYVSLKLKKFLINLNNNEIVGIKSFKFILDKNIDIEIQSIIVMVSTTQAYKLFKMSSIIQHNSFISVILDKNVEANNIQLDKITCKIPMIQFLMQQAKSKRNISLNFINSNFMIKNSRKKAELYGQTTGEFIASDGFLSFNLTQCFKITINGEYSEIDKNFSVEVQDPIIFELTTFTINQILKNLTATEDKAEKQYSISNETGTDISIIINNTEYKLKSQEFLPNITNLDESDIKVKIGEIINPFQLYSTYSKISTPFFFDKNFILVWMDTKKLQLRLLSPIIFKNKSSINLEIQVNDISFEMKDNSIYNLEYTTQKVDLINVKYNNSAHLVNLDESSVIKLENNYIIVSKKRKIETLRTTIVFYVHFYFRNEMISNIVILIKGEKTNINEKVTIKPYQIIPIPFFLPSLEILSFDI